MAGWDKINIVDDVKEFLASINTGWDYLAVFGICCGAVILIKCFRRCILSFYTYVISKLWYCKDFTLVYGGTWAVVTGSSDGIGRSYALQLAKRKLNIFLISRNINKMEVVANDIKSKYDVCVRCYPMNLCYIAECDKYEDLKNELSSLDIGILVNNVGIMYDRLQYFLTVPKERQLEIIQLNITASILLTYMVLPQMVSRGKGAIINVSSGATVYPTPLMTTYSASKAFINSFTDALQYEYAPHGIVMQAVKPFYVSTNMTHRGKPNFLLVDPDVYVSDALRMLGKTQRTYGYWVHGVFGLLGEVMPEGLYRFSCIYINPYLWSWLTGVKADNKKFC